MHKRQAKNVDAASVIAEHVVEERIATSTHAEFRMRQYGLVLSDILNVLRFGWREPRKDEWNVKFHEWRYAYRGYNISETKRLRVAVALDATGALVVTVVDLDKD